MKMTVIVRPDGKVAATAQNTGEPNTGPQATLVAPDGYTVHEVDVPDEYERLAAKELHEKLQAHHLKPARS